MSFIAVVEDNDADARADDDNVGESKEHDNEAADNEDDAGPRKILLQCTETCLIETSESRTKRNGILEESRDEVYHDVSRLAAKRGEPTTQLWRRSKLTEPPRDFDCRGTSVRLKKLIFQRSSQ